jgi:hypothetical protein
MPAFLTGLRQIKRLEHFYGKAAARFPPENAQNHKLRAAF